MAQDQNITHLLTINEAASMMKVTRQTIYLWINSGKLKPVKIAGGRFRIPEEQLIIEAGQLLSVRNSYFYPIRDISDLEYESDEQMWTKEKGWFRRTDRHWYWESKGSRFLFKAGREGTGENWAEKIAAELCRIIGLPHADYDMAIYHRKKGVITPNFVPEGVRLELGNEIMARYLCGYEKTKRYRQTRHTLRAVLILVNTQKTLPPVDFAGFDEINSAIDVFLGYLMLDAWIANTDRHHENWGRIIDPSNGHIRLAPTFDHASSLGRSETDENRERRLTTKDINMSLGKYVERARSAFYNTPNDAKPLLTFEAFKLAAAGREYSARSWLNKLENVTEAEIKTVIDRVPGEEMSQVAREFTWKILDLNKNRLLALKKEELKWK
jgi:excisionase family DNA binding protein